MGMPAVSKRHTDPRYGLTPAQKVAQERRNAALRPFSLAEVAMIGKLGRLLPERAIPPWIAVFARSRKEAGGEVLGQQPFSENAAAEMVAPECSE